MKYNINKGNIGALLNTLSCIFGGISAIIGGFLILNKLNDLSKKYNDYKIIKYYTIAYIINITSFLIFILYIGNFTNNLIYRTANINIGEIYTLVDIFLIFYILIIIGTYFIKKAYLNLSKYVKNPLLNTVGNLYFYGTILSIIGIGLIMIFIAQFLEIKLYTEITN